MSETAKIVQFLTSIGITVREGRVPARTIVPGIHIEQGELVFDREAMLYPGDLLHEAGHLAVMPPEQRCVTNDSASQDPGEEMAAIAWSYAAALHIGLDPAIVFHSGGYREGSPAILENFREGRYVGVPLLEWMGLTHTKAVTEAGVEYPRMRCWLRSE